MCANVTRTCSIHETRAERGSGADADGMYSAGQDSVDEVARWRCLSGTIRDDMRGAHGRAVGLSISGTEPRILIPLTGKTRTVAGCGGLLGQSDGHSNPEAQFNVLGLFGWKFRAEAHGS